MNGLRSWGEENSPKLPPSFKLSLLWLMIINGVLENVQQSAIKRERKKEEENEALICSICHYLWCKYFHYGQPQCWEETHTVSPHILIRVRSSTPLLVMDMKE